MNNDAIKKFDDNELKGKDADSELRIGRASYGLHWHTYYEITYYRRCTGTVMMNGKNFEIKNNSLFFLTPRDFHKIDSIDTPDTEVVNISFSEQSADQKLIKELSLNSRIYYNVPDEIVDMIYMTAEVCNSVSRYSALRMRSLMDFILSYISEYTDFVDASEKYISEAVDKAIAYMLSDMLKPLKLADVAKHVNVSKAYLSSIFHKETGVTFKEYLNGLRCEYAKRLLEDNNQPIINVCYESGFNSLSQFMRAFKKHSGFSPAQYRKQL